MRRLGGHGALLVVAAAALAFLPGLGGVALFDRDEPRFAEAARAMIVRGDYLVPYFNGEPRLHKPPLIYWVMVGAYRVFGVNEFGARVGSALAGIGACWLLYLLAKSMFGPRVGLLAGVILATNLQTLVMCRAATADGVQLLTVMMVMLGFWRVHEGDHRWRTYILLYGGVALGGLCKGPVVPGIFLLTALGLAAVERDRALLRRLHLILGMLAAAAVVAAWFIPANFATQGAFASEGIGHHVLDRAFGEALEGHSGPFTYYVTLLPASFFPWFALLPLSILWLARDREAGKRRVFLLVWAAAPFLMFSFLKTKLPHYVLPAFPALAIIVAYGLDLAVCEARAFLGHWLAWLGIILFGLVGLASAVAIAAVPFYLNLPGTQVAFVALAAVVMAMLALTLHRLGRRAAPDVALILSVGMVVVALTLGVFCLPAVDHFMAARQLATALRAAAPADATVVAIGYGEPSLVFYAQRQVNFVSSWEQAGEYMARHPNSVLLAADKKLDTLPADLRDRLLLVDHIRGFMPSTGQWREWTLFRAAAAPAPVSAPS